MDILPIVLSKDDVLLAPLRETPRGIWQIQRSTKKELVNIIWPIRAALLYEQNYGVEETISSKRNKENGLMPTKNGSVKLGGSGLKKILIKWMDTRPFKKKYVLRQHTKKNTRFIREHG